jgi:hypothetical protein
MMLERLQWCSKNIFFTSKFNYLLFSNLTHKTETGQQIGEGLLIANHLDQLLRWADQKHSAAVKSYLLHSFLQVHSIDVPFTSHRKYAIVLT